MATKKYLDETGLSTLWEIIKTTVATKVDNTLVGQANGLATLDDNGQVPLSQLKNLDTTFAEVLTELPTSDIKRHLYLIKSTDTTDENIYIEYIYTGQLPIVTNTAASNYSTNKYDSSKWEKLGEYKADVDLTPYAKKSEALGTTTPTISTSTNGATYTLKTVDGKNSLTMNFYNASTTTPGIMSAADKLKLDNIAEKANNYSLPTASDSVLGGVKVGSNLTISNGVLSGDYKTATTSADGLLSKTDKANLDASVKSVTPKQLADNVTLTTTNNAGGTSTVGLGSATQKLAGVMTAADKAKLDGIAENANNYTLPAATSSTLGGIKVGDSLSIDNGILSVNSLSVSEINEICQ